MRQLEMTNGRIHGAADRPACPDCDRPAARDGSARWVCYECSQVVTGGDEQ